MKSFNDCFFIILLRLLLMVGLISQLPIGLGAVTSTGDLSIIPTTFTTYLEGNIDTKTTTTEAYPTLFDESDSFGKFIEIFYTF